MKQLLILLLLSFSFTLQAAEGLVKGFSLTEIVCVEVYHTRMAPLERASLTQDLSVCEIEYDSEFRY